MNFFGRFAVALVKFSTKILLGRLFVLSWAVGLGVNREEQKAGRYVLSTGFPPTPLLSYGAPAGQRSSVTSMQWVTILCWCRDSILTGVVQVAGSSKFLDPGSECSTRTLKS